MNNDLIVLENKKYTLEGGISLKLAEFERVAKEIKKAEDELKANILKEMEEKGIIKLESEDLTITYIAPSDRETFDKDAFKEKYQDLYDEYIKLSPVKSSIRIKLK